MNVPAARSALRIIRHLAERSGPVRAATIARELELPRSSVYHLLAVLQDEGFVVHSPKHQGYSLGPLIGEIGTTVLASDALARIGRPLLERLVAETKLPVVGHLGLLQHTDVVYAVKVAAARAPAVVTSVGVRLPAHLTATGRAMLAALPPAQFAANYSPGDLQLRTEQGPATVAALEELLAQTRDRGWATEDGDINPAYASVASAVLDHNDYPAAAVGLTFRRNLLADAPRLARAVSHAADTLSRRIRGRS
ncbi:IclR family transcriptional regulator [Cryobacterium sp. BB307]|uniref:IclR family transcriptional regulator n=1 Tax=Cryobacterium sp. BB307 TaxID=2716317 RepID=UPI001446ABDC|nr:IclR family transcriptional regulator [Cryobacterium sp. BB307]